MGACFQTKEGAWLNSPRSRAATKVRKTEMTAMPELKRHCLKPRFPDADGWRTMQTHQSAEPKKPRARSSLRGADNNSKEHVTKIGPNGGGQALRKGLCRAAGDVPDRTGRAKNFLAARSTRTCVRLLRGSGTRKGIRAGNSAEVPEEVHKECKRYPTGIFTAKTANYLRGRW